MGRGALGLRKKPAAAIVLGVVALVGLVLQRGPPPEAALPEPCYNHGSDACVAITADAAMRAYTGLQQVAADSPGHCEQRRFGHAGDGGWYACVEPGSADGGGPVRFLGQQPDTPCLVYSFGIRDDWTFDVAMRDAGCEVHSFDPTIGQPRRCRWGSDTSPHGCQPAGIEFHPIGLGAVDGERLQVDEDSAKHGGAGELKTLATIRQELGHSGRELTVLKFDIEGSEWQVLKQIAAHSASAGGGGKVAQILTEIHYWGAGCDKVRGSSSAKLKNPSAPAQTMYARASPARPLPDARATSGAIDRLSSAGTHGGGSMSWTRLMWRLISGTTCAVSSRPAWLKWSCEISTPQSFDS
jgi:hypothetical protein